MSGAEYIPLTSAQERVQVEPLAIGVLITTAFFGVTLMQFIDCGSRLQALEWKDKITLGFLCVFFVSDIVDTVLKAVFLIQYIHQIIVGGLAASALMPRLVASFPVLDGWIASCVHCVYTYRIVRLAPRRAFVTWGLVCFALCVSVAQFVGAAFVGWITLRPAPEWVPASIPFVSVWQAGSSVADVILCTLFVYHLRKHKSDFDTTNQIVVRWIVRSLETGLLPTVVQIGNYVAFWAGGPTKPWDMMIGVWLSKVYIIGQLVLFRTVLQSRQRENGTVTGQSPVYGSSGYHSSTAYGSGSGGTQWSRATSRGKGAPSSKYQDPFQKQDAGQPTDTVMVTTDTNRPDEFQLGDYYRQARISNEGELKQQSYTGEV